MVKQELEKKIHKNRELISKALELDDTVMTYYIIKKLAKENEKLIEKLKK